MCGSSACEAATAPCPYAQPAVGNTHNLSSNCFRPPDPPVANLLTPWSFQYLAPGPWSLPCPAPRPLSLLASSSGWNFADKLGIPTCAHTRTGLQFLRETLRHPDVSGSWCHRHTSAVSHGPFSSRWHSDPIHTHTCTQHRETLGQENIWKRSSLRRQDRLS